MQTRLTGLTHLTRDRWVYALILLGGGLDPRRPAQDMSGPPARFPTRQGSEVLDS